MVEYQNLRLWFCFVPKPPRIGSFKKLFSCVWSLSASDCLRLRTQIFIFFYFKFKNMVSNWKKPSSYFNERCLHLFKMDAIECFEFRKFSMKQIRSKRASVKTNQIDLKYCSKLRSGKVKKKTQTDICILLHQNGVFPSLSHQTLLFQRIFMGTKFFRKERNSRRLSYLITPFTEETSYHLEKKKLFYLDRGNNCVLYSIEFTDVNSYPNHINSKFLFLHAIGALKKAISLRYYQKRLLFCILFICSHNGNEYTRKQ